MAYGDVLVHTNGPSYGQNIVRNVGVSSGGGGGGAPDAHKVSHQDGGSDELDLTGLSGGFQNPFPDPVTFEDNVTFENEVRIGTGGLALSDSIQENLQVIGRSGIQGGVGFTYFALFNQNSNAYIQLDNDDNIYLGVNLVVDGDIEMRDGKILWLDTAKEFGLRYDLDSIAFVFEGPTDDVYLAGVGAISLQGNVGVDGAGTFSNYIMLDDEGRQIYSAKYTDLVENPSELELYQWLFGGSMLIGADLLLGKGANVFNRPNLVGNGLGPWVMDQYATVWIEGAPAVFDDFSITAPAALRIASGLTEIAPATASNASLNIPAGVPPTVLVNQDFWTEADGLHTVVGGVEYILDMTAA